MWALWKLCFHCLFVILSKAKNNNFVLQLTFFIWPLSIIIFTLYSIISRAPDNLPSVTLLQLHSCLIDLAKKNHYSHTYKSK